MENGRNSILRINEQSVDCNGNFRKLNNSRSNQLFANNCRPTIQCPANFTVFVCLLWLSFSSSSLTSFNCFSSMHSVVSSSQAKLKNFLIKNLSNSIVLCTVFGKSLFIRNFFLFTKFLLPFCICIFLPWQFFCAFLKNFKASPFSIVIHNWHNLIEIFNWTEIETMNVVNIVNQ